MAAQPLGSEEALVDLDDPAEGRQVALLGGRDGGAEKAEIPIHGLAVQPQKKGRLRCRDKPFLLLSI